MRGRHAYAYNLITNSFRNYGVWRIYGEAMDLYQKSLGILWKWLRNTVRSKLTVRSTEITKACLDNIP